MKFTDRELVFMMLAVQQRYSYLMLECAEEADSDLWWKYVGDRNSIISKLSTLLNEQVGEEGLFAPVPQSFIEEEEDIEEEEPPIDRFSY